MELICPECKNIVDTSAFLNLAKGEVVECNRCGITLMVTDIANGSIHVEVVDEMK
jgi:Zn ribbon nucleic-acid-binding protein